MSFWGRRYEVRIDGVLVPGFADGFSSILPGESWSDFFDRESRELIVYGTCLTLERERLVDTLRRRLRVRLDCRECGNPLRPINDPPALWHCAECDLSWRA